MIKSNGGIVEIKGGKNTILADITCLTRGLVDSGIDKKAIENAVALGFKSDSDIKEMAADLLEKIFEDLIGIKADLHREDGK